MTWKIILAAAALAAGPALADHPYANGEANSNGIAAVGVTQGTLHPGHVAVFASGKYNKPAEEFHFPEETMPNYTPGPGGWAETRRGGSFDR